MRPRVFPAEDVIAAERAWAAGEASMRPRVFPAEDIRDAEKDPGTDNQLQ